MEIYAILDDGSECTLFLHSVAQQLRGGAEWRPPIVLMHTTLKHAAGGCKKVVMMAN